MTPEELYRPISTIFTDDERKILAACARSRSRKRSEWARKANDSETAADMNLVTHHDVCADELLDIANQIEADCMVEDLKEQFTVDELIIEIGSRMSLCKRPRFEMYETLNQKVTNLYY